MGVQVNKKEPGQKFYFLALTLIPGVKFCPSLTPNFTFKNMDRKRRELHTIPDSLTNFCREKREHFIDMSDLLEITQEVK